MRVCKGEGKMGTGGFAFPEFTLLTRQSTHSDKEASTMSLSLGAKPSENWKGGSGISARVEVYTAPGMKAHF